MTETHLLRVAAGHLEERQEAGHNKYDALALQAITAAVHWLCERDFIGPRQPQ